MSEHYDPPDRMTHPDDPPPRRRQEATDFEAPAARPRADVTPEQADSSDERTEPQLTEE